MSAPKLPALRFTSEGLCVRQEDVSLDFPPSNKFSVSYAPSEGRQNSMGGAPSPKQNAASLSSSDGELQTLGGEWGDEADTSFLPSEQNYAQSQTSSHSSFHSENPAPRISRTLSMPLPSLLSQLHNPYRPSASHSFYSSLQVPFTQSAQVREVSMELADSVQLVIQTMLQISPPQVLDPAKEQFSACALSVPTSSMSAMFTAMKNINYISANMSSFCEQVIARPEDVTLVEDPLTSHPSHNEFDIGEMLQCVGDAMSGAAAHAGVDLVLYHGDVGLKHVYVSGDESSIAFALSHIVRQVLNTAERGDSIELGLLVSPISNLALGVPLDPESPPVDDLLSAAPLESNGPVRITIRISHRYALSHSPEEADHPKDVVMTEIRPKPSFSALLLRRVLKQIEGNLISDLPPPEAFTSGRTCDLEMLLERVPVPIPTPSDIRDEDDGREPTLEQLTSFGETLKGKRVALYASTKGSFAHHLTSYLTAWGMDVNHVCPDGQVDGLTDQPSSFQNESRQSSYHPLLATYPEDSISPGAPAKSDTRQTSPTPPSFIFIDDDVDVLKERLQALRFENQSQPSPLNSRKRPSLSSNHRPRSSPQITRLMNLSNLNRPPTPAVVMHFTSLANYKQVKDIMQSVMVAYAATATPLPEVMIIPKPAGPRRFLTALHTAITKPTVDPFFAPIATSPTSPGVPPVAGSSFFSSPMSEHGGQTNNNNSHGTASQSPSPSTKNVNRPHGSRTNSDRSTRSNDGISSNTSAMPPSPLAFPDNVEYFSAAAQKFGTSPSSGLVIQSPDGQTAGIYFHPRNKNASRNPSSQSMERDRGQLTIPTSRKGSMPRVPSGGGKKDDGITFSSLHEATQTKPAGDSKAGSSSVPSSSPGRVASAGPMDDQQHQQSSLSSSVLSPVPRRASDDMHKLSSPSLSPHEGLSGTSSRRGLGKRPGSDSNITPMSSRRKGKLPGPSDANVVPPISVLIVDDNPINQTILSTFMKRKRIKYDLASNGREAVQKWRTGGFHLILMDIQMPVMDGIQATKEIRRLEKSNAADGYPSMSEEGETPSEASIASNASSGTADTRLLNSPYRSSVIIVALTASSLQSDRVAALAAGCNDFLTKPVSLLWLNNKIIEWGSIKALQMWADIRPDGVRTMTSGQAAQARSVAERLHVPATKGGGKGGRMTPSPPPSRRPTTVMEDNAAALKLASSAGSVPILPPPSPTSAAFFKGPVPDRLPSASSSLSVVTTAASAASGSAQSALLNSLATLETRHLRKSFESSDDGTTT